MIVLLSYQAYNLKRRLDNKNHSKFSSTQSSQAVSYDLKQTQCLRFISAARKEMFSKAFVFVVDFAKL